MIKLRITFSIIVIYSMFSLIAFAQDKNNINIPIEIKEKALLFLDAVKNGNPKDLFSHFDDELKKEADIEKTKAIVSELKKIIGNLDKVALVNGEYHENEGGIYSLSYNVETNGRKLMYAVHIKKASDGLFVRGFNFNSVSSSPPSKQKMTLLHIIVAFFFILCIAIQLWCIIYFARKKGLKKKWLYIILSLVGFPAGIGINWVTGAFIVHLGFNIPAVSVSWPLENISMWSMKAHFPVGLIFLIKELVKKEAADESSLVVE